MVVPVFNKIRVLAPAVNSIVAAAHCDGAIDVVLVDNGSTDGSWKRLDGYRQDAIVRRFPGTTISSVRNFGARQGAGPLLCFLDADVLIPADYFGRLRTVFSDGSIAATGCECGLPPDPGWIETVWHRLNVRMADGDRHYLNSANFSVRRAAFDQVGGWPEEFQTSEDVELCRRLTDAGLRIYQSASLEAAHLDNPRSLGQFVRKTYWHGLGAVAARRSQRVNLPTAAAIAHCAIGSAGISGAFVLVHLPVPSRVALAASALLTVPLLAIAYRVRQGSRPVPWFRGLLLLELFLLARGAAAVRLLFGSGKKRRLATDAREGGLDRGEG